METLELTPGTVTENGLQLSTDSLINLNKAYMAEIVNAATLAVTDGHADEVKMLVLAKKGQELFKQLETSIRPIAEDKVKLGKGEIYTKFGVAISQKENGVSYDFTACNDPQWERLKQSADEANSSLKNREKTLKTFTKPVDVLDPETGEVTEVQPPIRSGKLGLNLSIK